MSKEKQRAIASKGGRAVHGLHCGAHEFTSEEAREAGRKGGLASAATRQRRRDAAKNAAADVSSDGAI